MFCITNNILLSLVFFRYDIPLIKKHLLIHSIEMETRFYGDARKKQRRPKTKPHRRKMGENSTVNTNGGDEKENDDDNDDEEGEEEAEEDNESYSSTDSESNESHMDLNELVIREAEKRQQNMDRGAVNMDRTQTPIEEGDEHSGSENSIDTNSVDSFLESESNNNTESESTSTADNQPDKKTKTLDINFVDYTEELKPTVLDEVISFVIRKSSSCYLTIQYPRLVFLDIMMFLGPGTSLEKYMKCFSADLSKMWFPYDYVQDINCLSESQLPAKEHFHNALRGTRITDEEYNECLELWQTNNCRTFGDYVALYNISDIKELPACTQEHANFFATFGVDLWKDGLSLPSLAMNYMFKTTKPNQIFVLVDNKNKSFYWKLRNATQGGLSIVIQRFMAAGLTTIRPDGKECKRVVSLDCNAMYLGTLTKPMPLNHFCTYEAPNYIRKKSFEFGILAHEWFACYGVQQNVHVRHKFNHASEFRIDGIGVDGYVADTNTVLQFHGCLWHGHRKGCKIAYKTKPDGSIRTHNPVNKKSFEELYQNTLQRDQEIIDCGYNLITKWECEWLTERCTEQNKNIINHQFYSPSIHPSGPFTQEQLIEKIHRGEIFGFCEVDMHLPKELHHKFRDFQPFYKNTEVTIDDVGEHMKSFASDNDLLKRPVKCLLLSYFTKKSMLLTPLIQWYLDHGCVIDKIHTFYSFKPEVCFTDFVNKIVQARRYGDSNTEGKIISEFSKLLGNSSIGKSLLQKEKHKNVVIANDKKSSLLINNIRFDELEEITENVYEMSMRKSKVRHNAPLTLGCVVYSYSKLEMLKFIYDFLMIYFDESDVCILNSDTDSIWLGLSEKSLDDLVKPDKKHAYYTNYHKHMPALSCVDHRDLFVDTKVRGGCWDLDEYPCCKEFNKHEQRTPLLFKYEYEGDYLIALTCKTYHAGSYDPEGGMASNTKQSTKGISKKHSNLTSIDFLDVLAKKNPKDGVNFSFITKQSNIYTYKQHRVGLSYLYYKRKVCSDGLRTEPTDL